MQTRATSEQLIALVYAATLALKPDRQRARRALIRALRADGYSVQRARTLCDRFVAEAREGARQASSLTVHQGGKTTEQHARAS